MENKRARLDIDDNANGSKAQAKRTDVGKDTRKCIVDNAVEMLGRTPMVHLHKICADLPAQIGECICLNETK